MKIETIKDLVDWTRDVHQHLGRCLAEASSKTEQAKAEALMTYVADHEAAISATIDGFEQAADAKALQTWVYDFLEHKPVDPKAASDRHFAEMSFDEISGIIFEVHNQVLLLYRYLLSQAVIPEAQELLQPLLQMEEHETMRLAQQIGRYQDF